MATHLCFVIILLVVLFAIVYVGLERSAKHTRNEQQKNPDETTESFEYDTGRGTVIADELSAFIHLDGIPPGYQNAIENALQIGVGPGIYGSGRNPVDTIFLKNHPGML